MADDDLKLDEEEAPDDAAEPDVDEDGEKKLPDFIYDEEALNLVPIFEQHPDGKKALREIADRVYNDFEADFEGSSEYRKRAADDWKIFQGDLPPKTFPHKDSANCHVPIMLENMTRNVFRAYAELFGDWDDVFGVAALGPNDEEMRNILTLHGNWQLRQQIPDFKRQMARGMLIFFGPGDVTCHSYWDPEREQNRHEILTPDDFVSPFVYVSTMPDYSDLPHRTKVMKLYRHELQGRLGSWENIDAIIDRNIPSMDDDPEQLLALTKAKTDGIDPDTDNAVDGSNAPYKMLWYEGWISLPNQEKDRFVQVVMDHKTKLIAELRIHEHPDWQDVARYDSQVAERDSYFQSKQLFEQQVQQQQMQMQELAQAAGAAGPMMGGEQQAAIDQGLQQQQMAMAQMQPPVAPQWMTNPEDPMEEPEAVKRRPVHLFAHGVLIEPITGALGIGYGRIEADYNRAANTALSQFTDSATAANVRAWIASDIVEIDTPGGKIDLSPGAVNRVANVSGDELRNALIPIEVGQANPQLIELVDKMQGYGRGAMQAPEVLSGEPGKSGETYRGIAARIEQATKQLSVSTRRYADFVEQILKNNALLNSIHLKDEEFFHVAAAKGELPKELKIGRRLYERNYHVEIRADLRFVSKSQQVQEADELLMFAGQVPMLSMNIPFMWQACKRALVARDLADMVPFLGPAPPPPMTPFGMPPPMPPGAGPPPVAAPGGPPGAGGPPGGGGGPPKGPPK